MNKMKKEAMKLKTFSKSEQEDYLKKHFVCWENLVVDKNGKVDFNEKEKKRLIGMGFDMNDTLPARWAIPKK